MSVFTLSIWIVKKGHEDEFAARWREMAGWTMEEAAQSGSVKQPGTLLRDRDVPNRFISFGLWDTMTAVQTWRANPGFGQHVAKLRSLLEDFSPSTLDDVSRPPSEATVTSESTDGDLARRVAALEATITRLNERLDERAG